MNILHFTGIRLLPWCITGIIFGFYADTDWRIPLFLVIIFMIGIRILYRMRNTVAIRMLFGSLVFITVFTIGWLSLSLHIQKNQPDHYSRHANPETENTMVLNIRKLLKPGAFYERYEAKIISINRKKASGKLLLNVYKDSIAYPLHIDDRFVVKTTLREVIPPLNPHQFNYKHYLEKQHIYHQLYVQPEAIYALPDSKQASVFGIAASWRNSINTALQKHGFKGDELAVINALLLGQRQDISDDVYTNYTRAGAIHILAVSGLHVGILLLILRFLLRPLERLRHGKTLKLLLIIALLWTFALMAGLSASVVRAVTMFSFVAWALQLKRTTNIYNILAISMLFLLLVKPLFLFDVGFQLSYSAVFSIVWLQPMVYKLWKPRFGMVDFFWKILTVTLAAQCGVAPLSLFYFHQFPGLFFVSNLVIIPVLGIVLGLGILVIVLALLNGLPDFLATAYKFTIGSMNGFIRWVAQQEVFLFRDITFDGLLLVTVYLALISGILMLKKPAFRRIAFFLVAVLMLQGVFIFNRHRTKNTARFIVFHANRNSLMAAQHGEVLTLHASEKDINHNNTIKNYRIAEHIATIKQEHVRNVYEVDEKRLLRVDSLGIYSIPQLHPDYVLLCDSPKINLERLILELKPEFIIADGSNYKSDTERWKITCEALNVPFHATGKQGAFVIGN